MRMGSQDDMHHVRFNLQQALPNYMAAESTTDELGETDEDREHDEHLALQERMCHLISFHAEMMGDIMYFQQAL